MNARAFLKWLPKGLRLIAVAPTISAIHFLVVYASAAIYCSRTDGEHLLALRIVLIGLTVLALGLITWAGVRAFRQRGDPALGRHHHDQDSEGSRHCFLGHVALLLAAVSVIGVCFVSAPLFMVTTCL